MKRSFATCTMALLVACAASLPCGTAFAGDYPERPVHWIVPYPPGGTTDVIARYVAQAVGTNLHGTIVVDNRAGAGGQIAMNAVTQADPDGYTLLVSDASVATVPSLYKQLSFDPAKLQAVALFATVPHIVVVNPTVHANSLAELIALSKKAPGTLNFGSGGVGSPLHLAGEALRVESESRGPISRTRERPRLSLRWSVTRCRSRPRRCRQPYRLCKADNCARWR